MIVIVIVFDIYYAIVIKSYLNKSDISSRNDNMENEPQAMNMQNLPQAQNHITYVKLLFF